ncbi:MAG: InlB B-repeat-containing protein [Eubacteriales bacterium]|nr:InlB B-repeat-containing protein [Eubacteriales bacterium]
MKRILGIIASLCLMLCLLPGTAMAQDTGRSYEFFLSVSGQEEVFSAEGQVLTVTLMLKRTDADEPAEMYGMQSEITYDDSFLELVQNSVMTAPGVEWTDLARRTGGRVFYLNYVSLNGGQVWEPEVVVGSFQLKVIASDGVSTINLENSLVANQKGDESFTSSENKVKVILSTDCKVTFMENGGSDIEDLMVSYGDRLTLPEGIEKDGYVLEGWYKDIDRTEKWDFDTDTVKGNTTLYANWVEPVDEANGFGLPWWIILIAALVLLILILLFKKKKVTFETFGGTALEPVYVKRGYLLEEPMMPVKPGAVFGGWYSDPEFKNYWDFEVDQVKKNMTLYAQWK